MVMLRVFILWKPVTTNQGSSPGEWIVKHLPAYHCVCLGVSLWNKNLALSSDYQQDMEPKNNQLRTTSLKDGK